MRTSQFHHQWHNTHVPENRVICFSDMVWGNSGSLSDYSNLQYLPHFMPCCILWFITWRASLQIVRRHGDFSLSLHSKCHKGFLLPRLFESHRRGKFENFSPCGLFVCRIGEPLMGLMAGDNEYGEHFQVLHIL
jgi:hypothetical protein